MIDTIVLYARQNQFRVLNPERFKVLGGGQRECNHGYIVYVQNPTKYDLLKGIYKPRLSLTKRFVGKEGLQNLLKIEMSLPKLLYGNNFQELVDSDYSQIKSVLSMRLLDMGIQLLETDKLEVASVHYSKNIILADYSTPYEYLDEIRKIDFSKTLDMTKTDYINEGYSLRIRCNSYEIIFYDKIKDLLQAKKSPKKAIEKDSTIQLHLFDDFQKRNPFEVLRMEVRLNKRNKIKRLFNELGIITELTFVNLFNSEISKKVLLNYLLIMKKQYPVLAGIKQTKEKLLMNLISENPGMKMRKALMIIGAKYLFDDVGVRQFRELMKSFGSRKWYSLKKELKGLCVGISENVFVVLEDIISEMVPISSVDI